MLLVACVRVCVCLCVTQRFSDRIVVVTTAKLYICSPDGAVIETVPVPVNKTKQKAIIYASYTNTGREHVLLFNNRLVVIDVATCVPIVDQSSGVHRALHYYSSSRTPGDLCYAGDNLFAFVNTSGFVLRLNPAILTAKVL